MYEPEPALGTMPNQPQETDRRKKKKQRGEHRRTQGAKTGYTGHGHNTFGPNYFREVVHFVFNVLNFKTYLQCLKQLKGTLLFGMLGVIRAHCAHALLISFVNRKLTFTYNVSRGCGVQRTVWSFTSCLRKP